MVELLTGAGVVDMVITDLGVFTIDKKAGGGMTLIELAPGSTLVLYTDGIPEAMEQILFNQSRIPPRVTFLKPLSAAVAIGTARPDCRCAAMSSGLDIIRSIRPAARSSTTVYTFVRTR